MKNNMTDTEVLQHAIDTYGEEKWALAKNLHNYKISTYGRVYSLLNNIFIKPRDTQGYLHLSAFIQGKGSRNIKIHRMVAEAFIPNPENKPFINHIDCNPSNNHVSNLEWCTQKENINHSINMGRIDKRGIKNHNVIIQETQVMLVKKLILDGLRDTEIGKISGVKRKTVFDIRVGKSWSFLTGFSPYSEYVKRGDRQGINIPYGNSKYAVEAIVEIKKMLKSGASRAYTARKLGVPSHLVGDILSKKSWSHIVI